MSSSSSVQKLRWRTVSPSPAPWPVTLTRQHQKCENAESIECVFSWPGLSITIVGWRVQTRCLCVLPLFVCLSALASWRVFSTELETNLCEFFTIMEKSPTMAFSWMKAATTAFKFKNLLRHYARRALTHSKYIYEILGYWHKSHIRYGRLYESMLTNLPIPLYGLVGAFSVIMKL